jgi:type II secretory pathway pseudopilin PulG
MSIRNLILEIGNKKTGETRMGFTLIETLVAISILLIAVIEPMSLTVQALQSAYYARDQVTAANLAQEAIEVVRNVRDGNVLTNAYGTQVDLLNGIPDKTGLPFRVDARTNTMTLCNTTNGDPADNVCKPLQTDGIFFGYQNGWATTNFTRTVTAEFVDPQKDEIHISVTVTWQTGKYQKRTFTLTENLYRWIEDGSLKNT